MTSVELYYSPGSLCSQKVKLVLAEKQLQWQSHSINLLTFENLQLDYMRLNPKGVVPTLVHNGEVICNSAVIVQYLDEQFPHPRLTLNDPALLEKMVHWIDLQDQFPMLEVMYGTPQGIDGFATCRLVQIKERMLAQLIESTPKLKEQYAAKLKDVKQLNSTIRDAKAVANINTKIEPLLDQLEAQLSQTEWLCGATYSLADTVWTAMLNRLNELGFGRLWENNTRPAIDSYFNQLKARPSFKTAIQNDKMPLPMLLAGLGKIFFNI